MSEVYAFDGNVGNVLPPNNQGGIVPDDQGVTQVTGSLPITSSGGDAPSIAINPATALNPGSMSAADKAKLDTVLTGEYQPVLTQPSGGVTTFAIPDANPAFRWKRSGNLVTVMGRIEISTTIADYDGFDGGFSLPFAPEAIELGSGIGTIDHSVDVGDIWPNPGAYVDGGIATMGYHRLVSGSSIAYTYTFTYQAVPLP